MQCSQNLKIWEKILKTSNKSYEITIKLENNMKSIWLKTKLYKHCALWPIFRWWCSNWRPILTWKPISRYPNIIRFVRCKPGNECLKSSTLCVLIVWEKKIKITFLWVLLKKRISWSISFYWLSAFRHHSSF